MSFSHTFRFVLCLLMALPTVVAAQERTVTGFEQQPPAGQPAQDGMRILVRTEQQNYYVGDTMRVMVQPSRTSYVYVFMTEPDGGTRQIFPNRFERRNRVEAGRTLMLPAGSYILPPAGPAGTGSIFAVATTAALPTLQAEYGPGQLFREAFPAVYEDPRNIYDRIVRESQEAAASQGDAYWAWGLYRFQVHPNPYRVDTRSPYSRDMLVEEHYKPRRLAPGERVIIVNEDDIRRDNARQRTRNGEYEQRERLRDQGRTQLRVYTTPDDADVYIDDTFFGETPLNITLDATERKIRIEKSGYRTINRTVDLRAGIPKTLEYKLRN